MEAATEDQRLKISLNSSLERMAPTLVALDGAEETFTVETIHSSLPGLAEATHSSNRMQTLAHTINIIVITANSNNHSVEASWVRFLALSRFSSSFSSSALFRVPPPLAAPKDSLCGKQSTSACLTSPLKDSLTGSPLDTSTRILYCENLVEEAWIRRFTKLGTSSKNRSAYMSYRKVEKVEHPHGLSLAWSTTKSRPCVRSVAGKLNYRRWMPHDALGLHTRKFFSSRTFLTLLHVPSQCCR